LIIYLHHDIGSVKGTDPKTGAEIERKLLTKSRLPLWYLKWLPTRLWAN